MALLFKFLLDVERRLTLAKEGREEALAGRRCRRRKDSTRRGCTCGGGSRVGVRSRGLSPESNRSQTAPNGRCYHYTTKPSRVKDAGARLVG